MALDGGAVLPGKDRQLTARTRFSPARGTRFGMLKWRPFDGWISARALGLGAVALVASLLFPNEGWSASGSFVAAVSMRSARSRPNSRNRNGASQCDDFGWRSWTVSALSQVISGAVIVPFWRTDVAGG